MIQLVVARLCNEFNIHDRERVMEIVSGKEFRDYMSLDDIAAFVCDQHLITIGELKSKKRQRELVEARVDFSRISNLEYGYSLTTIGRYMNRDHTTIIHYLTRTKEFAVTIPGLRKRTDMKKQGFPKKKKERIQVFEEQKKDFVRPAAVYASMYDRPKTYL